MRILAQSACWQAEALAHLTAMLSLYVLHRREEGPSRLRAGGVLRLPLFARTALIRGRVGAGLRLASISHISNALAAEGGVSHLNRLVSTMERRSFKEDGLERMPRLTSESTLSLLSIGREAWACNTLFDVLAGAELLIVNGSVPRSASRQTCLAPSDMPGTEASCEG